MVLQLTPLYKHPRSPLLCWKYPLCKIWFLIFYILVEMCPRCFFMRPRKCKKLTFKRGMKQSSLTQENFIGFKHLTNIVAHRAEMRKTSGQSKSCRKSTIVAWRLLVQTEKQGRRLSGSYVALELPQCPMLPWAQLA